MKRKIVGKQSLVISMAKHIKACARELKEINRITIRFKFDRFDFNTEVIFDDKCFCIGEALSIQDISELTNEALSESGCNGVIFQEGDDCKVTLFGKPTKAFKMLQRLIKKYSGTDIDWNYFKTAYYDRRGLEIEDETTYLCYNEIECQKGVNFIRKFRTSKDVLKVRSVVDNNLPLITSALKLIVETPHGKQKGEITLVG